LSKEDEECAFHRRCGAITPDGIIDEDFEEELGFPSQVISMYYTVQFMQKP